MCQWFVNITSMPVIKSAKKKLRADARKRVINLRVKRNVKDTLKWFTSKPTNETLKQAYSALDTAAKKNVIPKKRANRKKSRLAALLAKPMKKAKERSRKTKTSRQAG